MTSRRFIWTKFFFSLIPILLLGQLLVSVSSIFIGIDKVFILLMMGTTLLLCSSLVSRTLAFGTNDIQRAMKETDRERPQTASAIFMIASVTLIIATLALEIIPVFLLFVKESGKMILSGRAWLILGAAMATALLLHVAVIIFSLRMSIKKIGEVQAG